MKATYSVYRNGQHVANQLAGFADRACALAAPKLGCDPRELCAIDFAASTVADEAIAAANSVERAKKFGKQAA